MKVFTGHTEIFLAEFSHPVAPQFVLQEVFGETASSPDDRKFCVSLGHEYPRCLAVEPHLTDANFQPAVSN